jgi:hypothetical protein
LPVVLLYPCVVLFAGFTGSCLGLCGAVCGLGCDCDASAMIFLALALCAKNSGVLYTLPLGLDAAVDLAAGILDAFEPMGAIYGKTSLETVRGVLGEGILVFAAEAVAVLFSTPYTVFCLRVLSTSDETFLGKGGMNSFLGVDFRGILLFISTHFV